jgi:hypothetical protein
MKYHPGPEEIEQVNREILARRAERVGVAVNPTAGQQSATLSRQPSDFTGLTQNDFRQGMPALSDAETADWIAAYRAGYSRFAHDPQGEAIITLMEKRLATALEADGRKLPPFDPADRLRALRAAAAARANSTR